MLIAVEGLIGSGKTTLCKALEDHTGAKAFFEPVESNPFLEKYYYNPSRWAFTMQANLLATRTLMFERAHNESRAGFDCVMDRSFYGDYAFALVQKDSGYFEDDEFKCYEFWHETFQSRLIYPDLVLWLDITPENVMNRIAARGRNCEKSIKLEYLEKLNKAYKRVLNVLSRRCNIISLDASGDALSVLSQAEAAIDARRREMRTEPHPFYK